MQSFAQFCNLNFLSNNCQHNDLLNFAKISNFSNLIHSENFRLKNVKIKILANLRKHVVLELCKGVLCADLGKCLETHIYLQSLTSIQPRTSPPKFTASRDEEPTGDEEGSLGSGLAHAGRGPRMAGGGSGRRRGRLRRLGARRGAPRVSSSARRPARRNARRVCL